MKNLKDSHLKYIYDITIIYYYKNKIIQYNSEHLLGIADVYGQNINSDYHYEIFVKRFDFSQLASLDEKEIKNWLNERWIEKDNYIEKLINEAAVEASPSFKRPAFRATSQQSNSSPKKSGHYVQVGSYIQKQNALKTQSELTRHGKVSVDLSKPVGGQQF